MEKTSGDVVPERVPTDEDSDNLVDTVPANRWGLDITTDPGYQKFKAVVDDVKNMVVKSWLMFSITVCLHLHEESLSLYQPKGWGLGRHVFPWECCNTPPSAPIVLVVQGHEP